MIPMITRDDLVRFLEGKGIRSDCPSCGASSWTVVTSNEDGLEEYIAPAQLLVGDPKDPTTLVLGGTHIPVVVMVCDNCFYIRQYARVPIESWLGQENANQDVDAGDGDD